MGPGFRHFFGAGALATFLAAGCNSVLGIEEAELIPDPGPGGGSGPSNTPFVVTCDTPDAECTECVSLNCPMPLGDALETNTSRLQLDDYRTCLGQQCMDTTENTCLEEKMVNGLGLCALPACGTKCSTSSIVPTKELYCSCMEQNCANWVATDLGGNCRLNAPADLEDLHCRWKHCEFATSLESQLHCDHAVGAGACTDNNPAITCTDQGKNISGYPCNLNGDCCSDTCQGKVCR